MQLTLSLRSLFQDTIGFFCSSNVIDSSPVPLIPAVPPGPSSIPQRKIEKKKKRNWHKAEWQSPTVKDQGQKQMLFLCQTNKKEKEKEKKTKTKGRTLSYTVKPQSVKPHGEQSPWRRDRVRTPASSFVAIGAPSSRYWKDHNPWLAKGQSRAEAGPGQSRYGCGNQES
jgi:hypothetical protein